MAGEIIWVTICMWLLATASFFPLGYFIYKYTLNSEAGPFAETDADNTPNAFEIIRQSIHALKKGLIGGK